MLEALKPCIEEAFAVQNMEVAADWIGRRGTATGATRDKRIKYAKDILQKNCCHTFQLNTDARNEKHSSLVIWFIDFY